MKDKYRRSIGFALTRLARLHRQRNLQLLGKLGLHPGQDEVLRLLGEYEAMAMGDLAEGLGVRAPTATKTVARLAAQGLIEREDTGGDGRVVRVKLTGQGATRALEIAGFWKGIEDEMLQGLDGKDRRRLRKGLRRAARNLAAAGGVEPGEDEDEDGEAAAP